MGKYKRKRRVCQRKGTSPPPFTLRPELLLLVLQLVQLAIYPVPCDQLLVRAHFAYLPLVQNDDRVGALNGGEPVRDDDGRAALQKLSDRLLNQNLASNKSKS